MIGVIHDHGLFVIRDGQNLYHEGRDRQPSPNARNTVGRFGMPGSGADRDFNDPRRLDR